jgi:hypothetical protein
MSFWITALGAILSILAYLLLILTGTLAILMVVSLIMVFSEFIYERMKR